jgi:putative tryptophan/tyrosine transport system substrate-binding protein
MRRRDFIKVIGGAVAAWPLAARAQQSTLPVVGFVNIGSAAGYAPQVSAFLKGLSEAGYVDGQNVAIEYRWANGEYDHLAALVDDLVRHRVSVIAATSTSANLVAKAATTTIPIVFTTGGDPVQLGVVASLGRPGGNVTGVSNVTVEVAPKRLELAHELVPQASVFGLLINLGNPLAENVKRDSQAAGAYCLVSQSLGPRLGPTDGSAIPTKASDHPRSAALCYAARLAKKSASAFFPSLAASDMLSKSTTEHFTGGDLPAR